MNLDTISKFNHIYDPDLSVSNRECIRCGTPGYCAFQTEEGYEEFMLSGLCESCYNDLNRNNREMREMEV